MKRMDKADIIEVRDINRKLRMMDIFDDNELWVEDYTNNLHRNREKVVKEGLNGLSALGSLYDFQYEVLIKGGGMW